MINCVYDWIGKCQIIPENISPKCINLNVKPVFQVMRGKKTVHASDLGQPEIKSFFDSLYESPLVSKICVMNSPARTNLNEKMLSALV